MNRYKKAKIMGSVFAKSCANAHKMESCFENYVMAISLQHLNVLLNG